MVSLPMPVDTPLPAPQKLPNLPNRQKRKALDSGEPSVDARKRLTASRSAPVRRSPRSHATPTLAPATIEYTAAPSPLAALHSGSRPQLSQAFRRLYGTTQHRGILAGLAILKLYCECLGTTWTGSSARDPIVFFRTMDMADTSKWQRLPAEFDRLQARAYSFTQPGHTARHNSDRSSGLGPVHGRPP